MPDPATPSRNGFPLNAIGMTCGSLSDAATNDGFMPDLVSAVGEDRVIGYVKYWELHQTQMPRTREQALALSHAPVPDRVVPLFAVDGTTVIGTYRSGGSASTDI